MVTIIYSHIVMMELKLLYSFKRYTVLLQSSLRYRNRLLLIVVVNYKNSSRQQIQVIIIVISMLK